MFTHLAARFETDVGLVKSVLQNFMLLLLDSLSICRNARQAALAHPIMRSAVFAVCVWCVVPRDEMCFWCTRENKCLRLYI